MNEMNIIKPLGRFQFLSKIFINLSRTAVAEIIIKTREYESVDNRSKTLYKAKQASSNIHTHN